MKLKINKDGARKWLTTTIARARNLPPHYLVPAAILAAVAMVVLVQLAFSGHVRHTAPARHTPVATTPAVAAPRATTPPVSPAAPQAPVRAATSISIAAQPATATSTTGGATLAAAPTGTAATAQPAAPPAGIAAGWVLKQVSGVDQFGRQVLVSSEPQSAATLAVATGTASGVARVVEWTCWIRSTAATHWISMYVRGGGGSVSTTVDGAPVGRPVTQYGDRRDQREAVMTLAPGWHEVVVTANQEAGQSGQFAIEVAIGSGPDDSIVPVPYAVPSSRNDSAQRPPSSGNGQANGDSHGR